MSERVQGQPPMYSRQAEKFLLGLDKKPRERIKSSIEKLPKGDVIPYKEQDGYFRLRVGSWRILFRWLEGHEQILIALVEGRGQAYKKGV